MKTLLKIALCFLVWSAFAQSYPSKAVPKGKLAFASPGNGTTPHLTAQNLFVVRWKADVTHIPFKGAGPGVAALLAGEPPIGCFAGSGPMSNIKAGKFRALAVSSAK